MGADSEGRAWEEQAVLEEDSEGSVDWEEGALVGSEALAEAWVAWEDAVESED